MFCPDQNLLFIHIPKTGGTSISAKLRSSGLNELRTLLQHATLQDWVEKLGKERLKEQFSFCVIRNPWDRMVSWYGAKFSKLTPLDEQPEKFREWLKDKRDASHWWYRPMLDYMRLGDRIAVKWILRFENLDAEWLEFIRSVPALSAVGPLEKLNPSRRRKRYQQYYDDETYNLVARLYAQDIREFGYAFEE
jgi:hypothetical protein